MRKLKVWVVTYLVKVYILVGRFRARTQVCLTPKLMLSHKYTVFPKLVAQSWFNNTILWSSLPFPVCLVTKQEGTHYLARWQPNHNWKKLTAFILNDTLILIFKSPFQHHARKKIQGKWLNISEIFINPCVERFELSKMKRIF